MHYRTKKYILYAYHQEQLRDWPFDVAATTLFRETVLIPAVKTERWGGFPLSRDFFVEFLFLRYRESFFGGGTYGEESVFYVGIGDGRASG